MEYYNKTARSYNELHGEEQKRKARLVLERIQVKKSDKLLDVGCGTGIATELFDCEKTGIDPSEKLLLQARFKTVRGVAENLPFDDCSFDIVISLTASHHFTDAEKAFNEMKRVAKRTIVVSVLKKSAQAEKLIGLARKIFRVAEEIQDTHDIIFICHKV
ncbi:methyltransferase domain-containing protein [Candidatus Woesearchaeota archaeon]|nr:MAG: methyltransferase domain-containing protein [Candidatus Woesearchaeota archaeon]